MTVTSMVYSGLAIVLIVALVVLVARMAKRKPAVIKESRWLTMRDGVRIAVDVMRPKDVPADQKLPTVLTMTCYWRSFKLPGPEPKRGAFIGPRAPFGDALLKHGYAVVVVDARGLGASEGSCLYPWSADEIADFSEVADWVVAQPWSNGVLGAQGHSYEGTTAMLLAASGQSALRAVVAREIELDLYADIVRPGGVFQEAFFRAWSENKECLETNRIPSLFGALGKIFLRGVKPVDEDTGGAELQKIAASRSLLPMYEPTSKCIHRDDLYDGLDVTIDDMSVLSRLPKLRKAAVPAQIWGSWLDGTSADSTIRLFTELPSVKEAWIGAWNHDGTKHASPFAEGGAPDPNQKSQWEAWLRFLEGLLHRGEEPSGARVIHYFTMGEETWKTTPSWPPSGTKQESLYLGPNSVLNDGVPVAPGSIRWRVDPNATTGTKNRWHTQLAGCRVRYGDRARADRKLATWTGPPLQRDTEITGYPEVHVFIRSTHEDGAFIAYLEAVDPNARVLYLTEGLLRALHRAGSTSIPTYRKADAEPLIPGERTELRIRMIPTSVLIPKGWRIRLAFAGADRETFEQIPKGEAPEITFEWGGQTPSALILPVVTREN